MLPVLLHVDDDINQQKFVRLAFSQFGFRGDILTAGSVKEALTLLVERARQREPLNLILVDMKLPDGMGLDVIREVKTNPYWHKTPVVVLSGEGSRQTINKSYDLGANCYFPKISSNATVVGSLKKLYACWLEGALLPDPTITDDIYVASLAKATQLRARTARYYADLSCAFEFDSEMMMFCLNRSLNEVNCTNLIIFFQNTFTERDFNPEVLEGLREMQKSVDRTLHDAEQWLRKTPHPTIEDTFSRVLAINESYDIGFFVEVIEGLLPLNPVAAKALENLIVEHLRAVSTFVSTRSTTAELRDRAKNLGRSAEQIKLMNT